MTVMREVTAPPVLEAVTFGVRIGKKDGDAGAPGISRGILGPNRHYRVSGPTGTLRGFSRTS